jgi:RNase P subunit RPR2
MNEANFLYQASHLLALESPKVSQSLMQKFLSKGKEVKLKDYCVHCQLVFIPSINCTLKLKNKHQVFDCNSCGKQSRYKIPFVARVKVDSKRKLEDTAKEVPVPVEAPKSKRSKKKKNLSDLLNKPKQEELSLMDFLGQL